MFAKHVPRGSCHSIFCLPHLRASRHPGSRVTRANCLSLPPVSMSYFARRCWNISTVLRFSSACAELKRVYTSDCDHRSAVRAGPSHRTDHLQVVWATQSTIRARKPLHARTTVHSVSASPSGQCELCRCYSRGDELVGYTPDGSSWKPVGHVRPSGTLYPLPVTVDSAPAAEPPRALSVEGRRYAESHPDSLPCLCSFVDACVLRTAHRPAERAPVIRMRDGSHAVSRARPASVLTISASSEPSYVYGRLSSSAFWMLWSAEWSRS